MLSNIRTSVRASAALSTNERIIDFIVNKHHQADDVAEFMNISIGTVNDVCFNEMIYLFRGNRRGELTIETACDLYQLDSYIVERYFKMEAFGRNQLPNDDKDYLSMRGIESLYGIPHNTISRMSARKNLGERLIPDDVGRKPLLSVQSQTEMREGYQSLQSSKNKTDTDDFVRDLMSKLRTEQGLSKIAPDPEISRYQVRRLRSAILPEQQIPTSTNERRIEALNDPFNALSNAIIAYSLFDPNEGNKFQGRFEKACISNMDAMSVVIGAPQKNKKVFMVKGTKEKMRELGRSASRVSRPGERKQRSIKLMTSCVADGRMTTAVHMIKQRTCKSIEVVDLKMMTQNCNHYLLIMPARPRKEELKKLLDMEATLLSGNNMDVGSDDIGDDISDDEEDVEDLDEDEYDENFDNFDHPSSITVNSVTYPTDVEVSRMLLKDLILPDLIRTRDASDSSLKLAATMNSRKRKNNDIQEDKKSDMVLTCDGDFPFIEAILGKLLPFAKENNIEFFKHSAGCSLWQQPLDLAKGFWSWRQKVSKPPSTTLSYDEFSPISKVIYGKLKQHNMDEASIELFVNNYFNRITSDFQTSFSVTTMSSGWERSGLSPFSVISLLRSCPTLHHIPDDECDKLIDIVHDLSVNNNGVCYDEDIQDALDTKNLDIHSNVPDVDGLCVNRQRALWLNKEGPQAIRHDRLVKKAESEKVAASNAAASDMRKKRKSVTQQNSGEEQFNSCVGPPPENIIQCGNPSCDSSPDTATAENILLWEGCSVCDLLWFCHKKCCRATILVKHMPICYARLSAY